MKNTQKIWRLYCQIVGGVVVEKKEDQAIITVYRKRKRLPSIEKALAKLRDCPRVDIIYEPELLLDL